jgi:hypothetical protein
MGKAQEPGHGAHQDARRTLDATLELEPGPGTVFELRTIVQEVRKRA